MLEKFLEGIHNKKYLSVDFVAKEDNVLRNRKCVPFDYGESKKYRDGKDRFHFLDLNSPDGKHNLSILPGQVKKVEVLNENFKPEEYVTWTPNWIIERDWGEYS
ncbi:MAG: hypothetical protein CL624_01415 [Arcobacter sp.]|nr:hypothetical protein [Arcobacter sp.]|tara:strand:- start:3923 stop:4234 length:312 start_codon:yes stop_codon:yes gene_type:complete